VIACDDARNKIALYVDRELSGPEALEFEAHLTQCVPCRLAYEDSRAVVDGVRAASPLYELPEHSYAAIEQLVAAQDKGLRRHRWLLIAAAVALVAGVIIGSWFSPWLSRRRGMPAQYASFAAEAHLLYAREAFPLDIVSREPQVVADWLGRRLPFHMTLPDYPVPNDRSGSREQKKYSLKGARLLQYLDQDVAYLAYEMDRKPISLVIASSTQVFPSGGETYRSGGLTFYSTAQKGLRMITWTDKGLTYALVSTLDVPGSQSCVICHGSANDRSKLENLRPSRGDNMSRTPGH
jgi:anti-sigma factor RsiW